MAAYFVTGTDTEVGKTFVSSALLLAAGNAGLSSLGLKPIAAGCEDTPQGLRNEDALALMAASNVPLPYKAVNPITLAPPIAPHIAADEAGIGLSAQALAHHCRRHLSDVDFSLVEGAGGWLVPLNAEETLGDLAIVLGLPVILVVGLKLGCINHALLTAQTIKQSGLTLAGWVANDGAQPMTRRQQNIETLTQRIEAPCLAELPRCQPEQAANRLDLGTLLG